MKRSLACIALAIVIASNASASIWQTRADVEKNYGEPVKSARELPWQRVLTYHFKDYEVTVQFFDGISHIERYSHINSKTPLATDEIQWLLGINTAGKIWSLQAEHRWNLGEAKSPAASAFYYVVDSGDCLSVETAEAEKKETAASMRYQKDLAVGKEQTFTGTVTFKQEEKNRLLVVHSQDEVIEAFWSNEGHPELAHLNDGKSYTFTLKSENPVDINANIAFVSDREHKNQDARGRDSMWYRLIRIQEGEDVLFDQSVCELHHIKMDLKKAEVGYGMYAPASRADAFCDAHFPHYRNYALGGCLMSDDSPKWTKIFVCSKCVAEAQKYKSEHPQEAKHVSWAQ